MVMKFECDVKLKGCMVVATRENSFGFELCELDSDGNYGSSYVWGECCKNCAKKLFAQGANLNVREGWGKTFKKKK